MAKYSFNGEVCPAKPALASGEYNALTTATERVLSGTADTVRPTEAERQINKHVINARSIPMDCAVMDNRPGPCISALTAMGCEHF